MLKCPLNKWEQNMGVPKFKNNKNKIEFLLYDLEEMI